MNIPDELSKARAELAAAQERLAKIEAEASKPKEVAPWEPKGGCYFIQAKGDVVKGPPDNIYRLAGSEYSTEAAALSALPYVTFFKRLCCLAQELNPSGKVGGEYGVYMCAENVEWIVCNLISRDPWHLFETREAAKRACAIMNRDSGWKVPAL